MATSLSSPHQPVLTISASMTQKLSGIRRNSNSITFSSSISSQGFNSLSSSSSFNSTRSFSRLIPSQFDGCSKLFRIRATILQDEEEKVVVEESFQSKTLIDGEEERKEDSLGDSASSDYERWIIKLEQSINIFLTHHANRHHRITRIPRKMEITKVVRVKTKASLVTLDENNRSQMAFGGELLAYKDSVIKILDTFYRDRHYARAFQSNPKILAAFISVLHLYESFGWWRQADYLKVHFAESWNEMHHLLIMEELGGNAGWFDRFLAQHVAVLYYFMNVFMYAISPRMAYHFSECVENHAYETYDKFLKTHGEELKNLPAPEVAVKYYTGGDLYLFDEFQTSRVPCSRRPQIENLYDVFLNIRDDEAEHCKTMRACQTHGNLRSPHSSLEDNDKAGCVVPQDCEGIVDCLKKSVTTSPVKSK
ncbi:hypothetical protein Cgig2_029397 [Carnegiea gigantea]|uniref:Ubiquinol oxidase n=1 Tax=Carnegiea gigantea TaxID=171969 RepID=A0A9Q1KUC1_9CARY|nr:hypothetical protein Cgig2_029397 [Carnegiea gigantea]